MSKHQVVRSWKDPQFRASLPDGERARLPESPVGVVEVPESDLAQVAGADQPDCFTVQGCTGMFCTLWCTITLQ